MRMVMDIESRSTRGMSFKAKNGIIYVSCNNVEDSRFIRETVEEID